MTYQGFPGVEWIEGAGDFITVDQERCDGCGNCIRVCLAKCCKDRQEGPRRQPRAMHGAWRLLVLLPAGRDPVLMADGRHRVQDAVGVMGMNEDYDVIVVGAGFGGPVAAHKCASAGLKTLMLDRSVTPGNKVVSGLAMPFYAYLYAPEFIRDGNPPLQRPIRQVVKAGLIQRSCA